MKAFTAKTKSMNAPKSRIRLKIRHHTPVTQDKGEWIAKKDNKVTETVLFAHGSYVFSLKCNKLFPFLKLSQKNNTLI